MHFSSEMQCMQKLPQLKYWTQIFEMHRKHSADIYMHSLLKGYSHYSGKKEESVITTVDV